MFIYLVPKSVFYSVELHICQDRQAKYPFLLKFVDWQNEPNCIDEGMRWISCFLHVNLINIIPLYWLWSTQPESPKAQHWTVYARSCSIDFAVFLEEYWNIFHYCFCIFQLLQMV